MKQLIVLLIIILSGCQAFTPDAPVGVIEAVRVDSLMPDSLTIAEIRAILAHQLLLPKTKLYVLSPFDGFEVGEILEVTTRDGKKGHPFMEGILSGKPSANGILHYWIQHNGSIIPVEGDKLVQNCKRL